MVGPLCVEGAAHTESDRRLLLNWEEGLLLQSRMG